jgi:hypothetical protein
MDIEKTNHWLTLVTNVGVLIGIGLLVYELNQNTNLMRAEMHAMRAEAKATRQMEQANSGEVTRIMFEARSAGFPGNSEALDALTPLDRFRYSAFISGLNETVQNWHYQCQEDLLDDELCQSGYESMARSLLQTSHGLGIDFTANRPSFVADLRRIGNEAGLPVPDEDGRWPQ